MVVASVPKDVSYVKVSKNDDIPLIIIPFL